MRAVEVRPAGAGEIDAVRELIGEYRAWLNMDLAFQEIDEELDRLPGDYAPPGGRVGAALLKLFRKEPGQQVSDDLRRFKQVMEIGEVVQSDASIRRRIAAARPHEPREDQRTVH